ncbi:hypothetical protein [Lichenifustis flavocetrariae]|uniref:Uncharacterized protein n=1 Tax=Lichenifustis flavocetrariae TaxID=2949735 RepID=A0AA41YZZ2_9HYPH|nr:hypothetical protein [Lichenifustis flavocetrariae]MCW6510228.1 hypothetical protein [Lichenifustis flavocetrariae]
MPTVKYRMQHPGLRPRRTRLEIPGWAGRPEPRANGSHEYAWHCVPFSEAAKGGIEIFYPYENELHVTMQDGMLAFEGDFGPSPEPGLQWPPFRSFGTAYYTYQILLDLKVEEGFAVKTETHPRFYTDATGTVPIAVPAVLRHWWPMMSFMVFKSPAEGQTHIFRPDEPFMQVTIVPAESEFELVEMPEEEAAEREMQARRIHASRSTLSADSEWVSSTNTVFDGTYRRIVGAAKASR